MSKRSQTYKNGVERVIGNRGVSQDSKTHTRAKVVLTDYSCEL